MEPLITAAIAVSSVVATKALEKTGENVGEALWDKIGQFLLKLKKQSPHTVTAIEKASDQPLDYGKAVLEVESAVKADPEIAQAAQELAAAVRSDSSESSFRLIELMSHIVKTFNSQSPTNQTSIETIEKIVNFAQRDINIESQTVQVV